MLALYPYIKHLHLTFIGISLLLFFVRFYWHLTSSKKLQLKWVKILPHINDTLLLLSALMLCIVLQQYPFINSWLTEKFLMVIIYILLGAMTLRATTPLYKGMGFIGALLSIAWIGKVAVTKSPFIF